MTKNHLFPRSEPTPFRQRGTKNIGFFFVCRKKPEWPVSFPIRCVRPLSQDGERIRTPRRGNSFWGFKCPKKRQLRFFSGHFRHVWTLYFGHMSAGCNFLFLNILLNIPYLLWEKSKNNNTTTLRKKEFRGWPRWLFKNFSAILLVFHSVYPPIRVRDDSNHDLGNITSMQDVPKINILKSEAPQQ